MVEQFSLADFSTLEMVTVTNVEYSRDCAFSSCSDSDMRNAALFLKKDP